MKITKIDGVSHYKKQDKGILKKKWKDLDERRQREKIEARYNKQIESKIYKEFFRLKNKKRIEVLYAFVDKKQLKIYGEGV